MSNGTVKDLGDLHGIIARTLKDQLINGVTSVSKDGTIECLGANNEDIKGLVEELPFDETPSRSTRTN